MKAIKQQSRREFIKICSLSAGGLFLVAYVPSGCTQSDSDVNPNILSPSSYLRIDSLGAVTVMVHRTEMGQGVLTSLPMIVAEELEVNWKDIRIEQADGDSKYGNQMTMGSNSIRLSFTPFRIAGATAKEMLISSAALKWGIEQSDCYAENGFIFNKINGNKFTYGELVIDAAKLPIPQDVKLKDPKDYKIIGKRIKRVDTPAKIYGTAKFGIDIVIPEMVYASVKRPPTFGGSVKSFDASTVRNIKGVYDVIQISTGIAIIADSTWTAFKAQESLNIEWNPGPHRNLNTEIIRKEFLDKVNLEGTEAIKLGDPDKIISENDNILNATYELPFLAHAPMEPVNCVANLTNDKAEIWAPTQNPQELQYAIARNFGYKTILDKLLGLKGKEVIVHVTYVGGGFGRKDNSDFGMEAAEISHAVGKPVKLTWSREDDMKHGQFRPASMHNLKGVIDNSGNALMFSHHVIAPSIRANRSGTVPDQLKDYDDIIDGTDAPYNIPNVKISGSNITTPVPLYYWRAVYNSQNPFAVECFIDEMAIASKKDPVDFRLGMMEKDSRLAKVINLVREKSDWSKKLPVGSGRGIAAFAGFGSYNAQVAELTVKNNKLILDRFISVIDCGLVINPDGVEAQMEGAIIFALSAALKGEIIIQNGGIENSNFYDYPILEYSETPIIETHLIKNDFPVGGVGEVGVAATAPAICNAIYNATGKRIRRLPVKLSESYS